MAMTGKLAIIGDGDSVLAFKAGGVDSYSAVNSTDAGAILTKIAKQYQIIFITDDFAKDLDQTMKKYLTSPYPIILTIPSKNGSNGYGVESLKKAMDKALGVDILFNKDEQDGK